MITSLKEIPTGPRERERRGAQRMAPAGSAVLAKVTTPDGTTHHATVSDISTQGVRLLGESPAQVGDRVRLEIHLDSGKGAYSADAIVQHRGAATIGAKFTL